MKKNILNSSLFVLLSVLSLCGCSSDDETIVTATDGTTLTVIARADNFTSTDGTPQTRAKEGDNHETVFTDGDKIGVFAVKGGSVITECNNVLLTYDGENWNGTVYKYADATYFAYYPYDENLNTNITGVSEIVSAFNTSVAAATDQSTYEKYTACDLMTASSDHASLSDKTLTFTFSHQMSMVEISLPMQKYKTSENADAFEYSSPVLGATFSITPSNGSAKTIKPYNMGNGVYRYIVPPTGSAFTAKGEFKTTDGKTIEYSKNNLSLSTGNYKRLNVTYTGSSTVITRVLAVGDFYYFDGSILPCPQEEGVTVPSEGCIGVIYCTDPNRIDNDAKQALATKGVSSAHGLVMALTNASEGCRWGNENQDENSGGSDGQPFYENTDNLKKQYNNISGYAETQWIINTYNSGTTLQNTYTAFYHANNYGKTDETKQYAAPENTTGWFIPSMGQWWDILSNLGGIELSNHQNSDKNYVDIAATTAVNKMNTYLTKVNGATPFDTGTYFLSSSECSDGNACNLFFNIYGYLGLTRGDKADSGFKVRCSFAF